MKRIYWLIPLITISLFVAADVAGARNSTNAPRSDGVTFTYQGQLKNNGTAVNNVCDFQFGLWDAASNGTQVGITQTLSAVKVTNGLFTVGLDFGPVFTGQPRWLAITVRRPTGSGTYTLLNPRQQLTAAPLAFSLVPHATIHADGTYPGNSALIIQAPTGPYAGNPAGLEAHADPSSIVGTINPVGVWGDSSSGYGVWGTTDTGAAIYGLANGTGNAIYGGTFGTGNAGYFDGNVTVNGKLNSHAKVTQVINVKSGLPLYGAPFSSSGGTLVIYYSGSGYSGMINKFIGMNLYIDGNLIDSTGVFANQSGTHLAFVAKQWVLTGHGAGSHSLSLTPLNADTLSNIDDIFFVTVMEMPF